MRAPAVRKKEEKRGKKKKGRRGKKKKGRKHSTIQAIENAKHLQTFSFFTLKTSGIHNPDMKGPTPNPLERQNSEGLATPVGSSERVIGSHSPKGDGRIYSPESGHFRPYKVFIVKLSHSKYKLSS